MTTTDEVMRLADIYWASTGNVNLPMRKAALRTAVESLVADAERYRWLRDEDDDPCLTIRAIFCSEWATSADVDNAIDTARAALKGKP